MPSKNILSVTGYTVYTVHITLQYTSLLPGPEETRPPFRQKKFCYLAKKFRYSTLGSKTRYLNLFFDKKSVRFRKIVGLIFKHVKKISATFVKFYSGIAINFLCKKNKFFLLFRYVATLHNGTYAVKNMKLPVKKYNRL